MKYLVYHKGAEFGKSVVAFCDQLRSGDEALLCVYKWNDSKVRSAVVRAANRGANLRCTISVSDDPRDRDQLLKWAKELKAKMPDGTVTITPLRPRKNHSKWAAFRVSDNISIIHSSCNLWKPDYGKGQNSLCVDCGKMPDVWDAHLANYLAIVAKKPPTQKHLRFGSFGLRWFPRTAKADYVASTLKNIRGENAVVQIMMARWPDGKQNRPGRSEIVTAIRDLVKAGHKIKVLLRIDDVSDDGGNHGVGGATLSALRKSGAEVRTIRVSRHNYHQKWWSIKGEYKDESGIRKIVFSGSQ